MIDLKWRYCRIKSEIFRDNIIIGLGVIFCSIIYIWIDWIICSIVGCICLIIINISNISRINILGIIAICVCISHIAHLIDVSIIRINIDWDYTFLRGIFIAWGYLYKLLHIIALKINYFPSINLWLVMAHVQKRFLNPIIICLH